MAGEWYQGSHALRLGLFDLSTVPNSTELDPHLFQQFELVAEVEKGYEIARQPGVLRLLGFAMHAKMGAYDQATAIGKTTGQPADIAAVRAFHTKFGLALNLQQQLAADIGAFARISAAQGKYEAFEFTDVNGSVALGLSISGNLWHRPEDVFGMAGVVNRGSSAAERFLDAGGLGILVGDGQLPRPGSERVLETYYKLSIVRGVELSLDYQFIDNPAYNRDRGPVSIFAARFHAQF